MHLRQYRRTPDTPIYRYFSRHRPNTPQAVSAQGLGLLIREGAALLSPDIDVSALLLIGVDSNLIRLLGRWQSDAMLRYLHVQAAPIRHSLASRMASGEAAPPGGIHIAGVPQL